MNKLNILKSKKVIVSIFLVLTVLAIVSTIGIKVVAESDNNINEIMKLIKQGQYDEALVQINSIEDLSKYNEDEVIKVNTYKEILKTYVAIDKTKYVRELLKELEEFEDKYKESLNEEIFVTLNGELQEKIGSSKERIKSLEIEKENIKLVIEQNIEEAENLLKSFKAENPSEDIEELEAIINKNKEGIEKKKAEDEKEEFEKNEDVIKVEEEEKVVVIEESGNISEENNIQAVDGPKIAGTNAAKSSSQLITVVSTGGSYGELVMWEKNNEGKWVEVNSMAARLGQNGMKYYGDVYEMDKCTPTGIYSLSEAFGINANPGSGVPYRVLDGSEYWVDDVDSEYYNTMQFGEANGRWNSAEHLTSWPGYYNYALVIDYNRWPVISGKSSAIFLHCDMGIYTYGCVAIEESKLVDLLTWISPGSNPKIILDFSYDNIYNNY